MTRVYIGMGSNEQPRERLAQAQTLLQAKYSTAQFSPVYESRPVGIVGNNFLNCVLSIEMPESLTQLHDFLRAIEQQCGRDRSSVTIALDLDILTWGDVVGVVEGVQMPRAGIIDNAFILQPMAALAPEVCDPVSGKTWQTLWRDFTGARDTVWLAEDQHG